MARADSLDFMGVSLRVRKGDFRNIMRLRQAAGCGKRRLDRDPEKPFNLSKTLGLSTQSTYLDNKILKSPSDLAVKVV